MSSKAYYERYWSPEGLNPRGVLPTQLRDLFQAHIPSAALTLDVGCGSGRKVGLWMQEQGRDYLGVDISDNAVQQARSLGLNARTIENVTALPFSSESFDAVTCTEVLEHLFQPELVAAEMFRVLSPGGVLIVTVPNVVQWCRRVEFALLGRWNPVGDHLSVEQPWRDPHLRFFSQRAIQSMIEGVGFESIEVGGHDGGFLRALPIVGRRFRGRPSSRFYRELEKRHPSLLSVRLHVVARKPTLEASRS